MTNHTNSRAVLSMILFFCIFLIGCDRSQSNPSQQHVIDGVRAEVAKILKKDTNQIDVSKPLAALGADDLTVVEIVMALEEKFKVKVPDSAIGDKHGDVSKTLTVQKLAEIVSKQSHTK